MRASRLFVVAGLFLLPAAALAAARFPDVPADYAHRVSIEALADLGVIGGNPDGTFRPHDPVDRASMLKMLYKAAGIAPDASKKGCFPGDVVAGSWYEQYVCDAFAKGYVQGYGKNSFKPGRPVSRAEALKLSLVILGVPSADLSADVSMYADVSSSDWFATFVHTALARGVLPIPGQDGSALKPNVPLERGEAAAYIWNALHAAAAPAPRTPDAATSSSPSVASANSAGTQKDAQRAAQRADEQKNMAQDKLNSRSVGFPFQGSGTFSQTHPFAYLFHAASGAVVDIHAWLPGNADGQISCRLYRLDPDGFSSEYYLGYQENGHCYLLSALSQGDYQLQIQSPVANAGFRVEAKKGTGDGNDGFSQSKSLDDAKLRVDVMDSNDLEDWYKFTVPADAAIVANGGKQMTVNVVSSANVSCLIYPMADVDLFGFTGPQCNQTYLFPPGTYRIDVRHAPPRQTRQTYSIQVK